MSEAQRPPSNFRSRIAITTLLSLIAVCVLVANIQDSGLKSADELIAIPFFDTHERSALSSGGSTGSIAKVALALWI